MFIKINPVTNWHTDINLCRTNSVIINDDNIIQIIPVIRDLIQGTRTFASIHIPGYSYTLLVDYDKIVEHIETLKIKAPRNLKIAEGGNV